MALQSRLHEDESRFANSVKAKGGSFDDSTSSPSIERANRKLSKVTRLTSGSPVLRARTSITDLMFDMEDENGEDSVGPTDHASTKSASDGALRISTSLQDGISLSEASRTSLRSDAKGKTIDFESMGSLSPGSTLGPQLPFIVNPTHAQGAATPGLGLDGPTPISSKPWGLSALSSSKLDMRDIMAQAASSQASNISLGLAQTSKEERVAGAFTGRVSQRERKKQHQQQNNPQVEQQQQVAPAAAIKLPLTPTTAVGSSAPKSPWQGASTGPKVSLKDILGNGQQSHADQPPSLTRTSSIPPLTLQQTVPGGPPSAKRVAVNKQQSSSSDLSMPNHASPSSSSPGHPGPSRPSPQQPRHPRPQSQPQPSRPISTSTSTLSPPTIKSIRHNHPPTSAEPSLQLSMSDILSQQQTEKDIIKEAVAKRSLQEIQQEQEFQEWWDQESRKVRMEEEEEAAATRKGAEGGGRGRRGGGARGKGGGARRGRGKEREAGRGRGRGEGGTGRASVSMRGSGGRVKSGEGQAA